MGTLTIGFKMAYNENIPQASDNPSQSQAQILDNFQEISTAFNTNHGNFNAADQGKHSFLQMPEQGSAPATSANEGGVYTKEESGATQLFWRNESNGTEQQVTNTSPNTVGNNRDWNFSDGQQMRLGTVVHNGTATNVTFSSAFSNAAYIVQITPLGAAALVTAVNVQNLTTTGFTLASTTGGGGTSFYYLAIGS